MVPWNRSSYFGNHHFSVPCNHQATDFNRLIPPIPVQQLTRSRVNGALLRGMRRQNAVTTGNFPLMQRGGHSERFRFFRTKNMKKTLDLFTVGLLFLWMRRRKNGPNPNFGGISGNMGRDTHTQPLSYKMIHNSSCHEFEP